MKLFIIPKGTKVALGNGDGNLKVFTTAKEFAFSDFVSDPLYYYNQKYVYQNEKVVESICQDPTIKSKHDVVAKYSLESLDDGEKYNYKFLYVDYSKVKVLC